MQFLMTTTKADPPDEKLFVEMGRFVEELIKAGVLLATGGLGQDVAHVTSSGGKITVTDKEFGRTLRPAPACRRVHRSSWVIQPPARRLGVSITGRARRGGRLAGARIVGACPANACW